MHHYKLAEPVAKDMQTIATKVLDYLNRFQKDVPDNSYYLGVKVTREDAPHTSR